MNIDLQVTIWTIEHLAAALHASVDTAREYTYGQPKIERSAERLDRVWPDTDPDRNLLVAQNDAAGRLAAVGATWPCEYKHR